MIRLIEGVKLYVLIFLGDLFVLGGIFLGEIVEFMRWRLLKFRWIDG